MCFVGSQFFRIKGVISLRATKKHFSIFRLAGSPSREFIILQSIGSCVEAAFAFCNRIFQIKFDQSDIASHPQIVLFIFQNTAYHITGDIVLGMDGNERILLGIIKIQSPAICSYQNVTFFIYEDTLYFI